MSVGNIQIFFLVFSFYFIKFARYFLVTVHDLEGAVDNNLPLKYTPFFILEEQKIYTSFSTSSLIFTVRVVRHWDRLPWAVVMELSLAELKKCLDNTLRHMA